MQPGPGYKTVRVGIETSQGQDIRAEYETVGSGIETSQAAMDSGIFSAVVV